MTTDDPDEPPPDRSAPSRRRRLPADRRTLRVLVCDHLGRPVSVRGLGTWLAEVAPARARGSVTIALVSDRRIRALNRRFRGIDRLTDVLTFPAGDGAPAPDAVGPKPLGDIVIARDVARRQARRAGHAISTELRVLALHGLLHLLGYDHERDAGTMARIESRLRRRGGLDAGLIERGAQS